MVSAAKKLFAASATAFAGVIGFSYTDPRWTQRRFDPSKIPPLVYPQNPSREECLQRLKSFSSPETPMDVLIIGGGSVGAGAALDAVTRGLRVGLVEMNDYASCTSSRSTKLIHGGIRYLEKAVFQLDVQQLKLVAEALRERSIMIHQAPHLCHILPTIIPCYDPYDLIMYWSGVKLYDIVAMLQRGTLRYAGFLTPYATMRRFPRLRHENDQRAALLGAVEYFDGQFDDARMCLSAALTAASYGAAVVNYAKAEALRVVPTSGGARVVEAELYDRSGGGRFRVYAKAVLNAGGPLSAAVERLLSADAPAALSPSAGTHVVLDAAYCPAGGALVAPSSDGRVVFLASWLRGCVVGTTDRPCAAAEDARPSAADVSFLLRNASALVGPIPPDAVRSAWCGIRPLAASGAADTQSAVREHAVQTDAARRAVRVTGGKWTTYRQIAEDAVDALVELLPAGARVCVTAELRMVGAHRLDALPPEPAPGVPLDVHTHWCANYGDRYEALAAIATNDEAARRRLHPKEPITAAEVTYAVRFEHCERVQDFIARRTRLSFLDVERAKEIIPAVAQAMAEAKKWNRSKRNEEIANAYASLDSFRES